MSACLPAWATSRAWRTPEALNLLATTMEGLTEAAAAERLEQFGPNEVSREKRNDWAGRLWHAVRNPLVILLSILAFISFWTAEVPGDPQSTNANLAAGWIIVVMVVLGLALRFIQESRADAAAAKLKAMIRVTATVIREGHAREVPLRELVAGDIVKLCAGDMVPGDVRVLTSKDLFIIQATLTGESLPVEKFDARDTRENIAPLEHSNLCFLAQRGKRYGAGAGGGNRRADLFGNDRQELVLPIGRDQLR